MSPVLLAPRRLKRDAGELLDDQADWRVLGVSAAPAGNLFLGDPTVAKKKAAKKAAKKTAKKKKK
jgi:hypothetical protein